MEAGSSPIRIFDYLDYRRFLRDWYSETKKRRTISLRSFAQRAGLRSFNFFKLVIDGQRNLTEESIAKISKGLRLNKQEQEFFRNLVFYNQSKTSGEKDSYYQRMVRSQKFSQLQPILKDQYQYYSTWYHPVVRELVASPDFDGTSRWIAQKISPTITSAQAERSMNLLERLGFIQRRNDGTWYQSSSLVSTGSELKSHVVHQYHKLILDLTKTILDEVPPERRDVSTMTLGVIRERVPELKKKIQEFRQEILKLVSADNEPQEVVQLNIQMFPLTQPALKQQGVA